MDKNILAGLCFAAVVLLAVPAVSAQDGRPQVSMVTLQVVQNSDGSQNVVTPKGDLATLPGAGVNGPTAEIYMGAQGGFWYTDRTGQVIDLNPTVRALQERRARNQRAAQVPQYAPEPYYQESTQAQTNVANSANPSNSGGTSGAGVAALGTAVAAGAGAMAGAAMSNHYYNAPYGTPMYYGSNGHPYEYRNGERREFDELNQNQKAVLYNKNKINKQNQQQAVQQGQANKQARLEQSGSNQQNRQQSMQNNQSNRQSQLAQSGAQQQNFQHQQQWYQEQLTKNPKKFQKGESNPFVAQQGGASRPSRENRAARGGGGRGARAGRGR